MTHDIEALLVRAEKWRRDWLTYQETNWLVVKAVSLIFDLAAALKQHAEPAPGEAVSDAARCLQEMANCPRCVSCAANAQHWMHTHHPQKESQP